MSPKLRFTKMHGLGNDFIVIDSLFQREDVQPKNIQIDAALARKICHRRFGVGADQILWLKPAQDPSHDVRMEILNADGSVAEMCGNGIRAVGLYISKQSGMKKSEYRIETLAGTQIVQMVGEKQVRVNMGRPKLGEGFLDSMGENLTIDSTESDKHWKQILFYEVSMGNPHAVIFADEIDSLALSTIGPKIENHPRFPNRTNVEFVKVISPTAIQVRVWERGAGATLACGTGACAAAVAAIATKKVSLTSPIDVILPGGTLQIEWNFGQPVMMQGPAEEVFSGEIFIS